MTSPPSHLSSIPSTSDDLALVGDTLSCVLVTYPAAGSAGKVHFKAPLEVAFLLRFSINSAKGQPGNAMLWKVSSILENQVDKGYVLYTFEKNDIYKKKSDL